MGIRHLITKEKKMYSIQKTIAKGISGGIRTAICGGGGVAAIVGPGLEAAITTIVTFVAGFAYSAIKNYIKNR